PFPTGSTFTTPTDGLLHCYWIHGDATDWISAESRCESEGGTLATSLSSQENMFVLQIALQGNLFKGEGVSLGATDGKSSSDKSGAGQYAWVTGEPWAYTNWQKGQPSGTCTCQGFGNTTCTCDHWLAIFNDGTWHDVDESATRPSICEAVAR
ncbi:MAG TPA: C-type lectin domain-containing protein, partial [Chloroflexota bacterium]